MFFNLFPGDLAHAFADLAAGLPPRAGIAHGAAHFAALPGDFALAFAVHRLDTAAEVIQEAALLHDFAEMLLWCHAPGLARAIRDRQRADPTLRSAQAQLEVLGIRLEDLQQALMRVWRLPELLAQITDHSQTALTRVRNVLLAVDLARHSQHGWDNPAIPDDIAGIARLLNLTREAAREKVMALEEV